MQGWWDWRVWVFLTIWPILGISLLMPGVIQFAMSLPSFEMQGVLADLPFLRPYVHSERDMKVALTILGILQPAIMVGLAAALGLGLASAIGHAPRRIGGWLRGNFAEDDLGTVMLAGLVGLVVGAALIGLDRLVFGNDGSNDQLALPLWQRLGAGVLYGGIGEEVLCRLLLVSFVVWIGYRIWSGERERSRLWLGAVLIAAVLFAVGHLPAAYVLMDGEPPIARIISMNTAAGIVFGWLYWRHGLEAAIIAHMTTHLPLQIFA